MFKPKLNLAISLLKTIGANPGISGRDLATQLDIGTSYIDLIFSYPGMKQFFEGRKGPGGGYWLKAKWQDILLIDVAKALGYGDDQIYTAKFLTLKCSEVVH